MTLSATITLRGACSERIRAAVMAQGGDALHEVYKTPEALAEQDKAVASAVASMDQKMKGWQRDEAAGVQMGFWGYASELTMWFQCQYRA